MTENVENLLLEHPKALRDELREFRNEFHTETENLKHRMSALETAMINTNCHEPGGSPGMMEETVGVRGSVGRGRSNL